MVQLWFGLYFIQFLVHFFSVSVQCHLGGLFPPFVSHSLGRTFWPLNANTQKFHKNTWPLQILAHFYHFVFDSIIWLLNTDRVKRNY